MAESGLILNGRYRLAALIAAGSMGEVWQGIDLVLTRQVAVKLISPGHARDAEGLARFRAESRHAASLAHPNIVQVFDYGEPGPPDPGYLVMEFVHGPSLAQRLGEGPLDPAATMGIVAQAARGLHDAHRAGLVHRDVKPANLLLSRGGLVKVTDFGIAYALGSMPVTPAGIVMGTPAYLAPEQATGGRATPAADLYALGVVAYECLTGRLPFDGEPLAGWSGRRRRWPSTSTPGPRSCRGNAPARWDGSLTGWCAGAGNWFANRPARCGIPSGCGR